MAPKDSFAAIGRVVTTACSKLRFPLPVKSVGRENPRVEPTAAHAQPEGLPRVSQKEVVYTGSFGPAFERAGAEKQSYMSWERPWYFRATEEGKRKIRTRIRFAGGLLRLPGPSPWHHGKNGPALLFFFWGLYGDLWQYLPGSSPLLLHGHLRQPFYGQLPG
jgi:hypothetical protein